MSRSDGSIGFAPSGDARIHYQTLGEGEPVVFVHAGIADSRMWDPQFESVPAGYQFVRLDLQGFGNTAFAGEPFAYHQDVLAVMDHLSLGRAFLVGCSIGGNIALEVAAEAPHRVAGLVLVGSDAPGFDPEPYESPEWPEAVAAFQAGDYSRVAELDAAMWAVGYGRTGEEVAPALIELVMEMDLVPLRSEADREEVRIKPDTPDPAALEFPTLVVVGEHDLPDMRAHADRLAEVLAGGHPLVIPGAAHLASLEQPAVFNRALLEFIGAS